MTEKDKIFNSLRSHGFREISFVQNDGSFGNFSAALAKAELQLEIVRDRGQYFFEVGRVGEATIELEYVLGEWKNEEVNHSTKDVWLQLDFLTSEFAWIRELFMDTKRIRKLKAIVSEKKMRFAETVIDSE